MVFTSVPNFTSFFKCLPKLVNLTFGFQSVTGLEQSEVGGKAKTWGLLSVLKLGGDSKEEINSLDSL